MAAAKSSRRAQRAVGALRAAKAATAVPQEPAPITAVFDATKQTLVTLVDSIAVSRDPFVIAQLSDLHCGSPYFDGDLLETAVKETVALRPDLVVIGGDLTAEGYAGEFRTAQRYLEPLFAAELT